VPRPVVVRLVLFSFWLTSAVKQYMLRVMYTTQQRLRIAAEAEADPRTVRRYLEGGTIRPTIIERIERAMKKLGIKAPREMKNL